MGSIIIVNLSATFILVFNTCVTSAKALSITAAGVVGLSLCVPTRSDAALGFSRCDVALVFLPLAFLLLFAGFSGQFLLSSA